MLEAPAPGGDDDRPELVIKPPNEVGLLGDKVYANDLSPLPGLVERLVFDLEGDNALEGLDVVHGGLDVVKALVAELSVGGDVLVLAIGLGPGRDVELGPAGALHSNRHDDLQVVGLTFSQELVHLVKVKLAMLWLDLGPVGANTDGVHVEVEKAVEAFPPVKSPAL